jgi:RNA polymerase sigma-70 factor (sigma-E family)
VGDRTASQRDSEEEFRLFVRREQEPLFRMAVALCGDRGVAEDLVQTALVRTYSRWERLRDENPTAYARRIVANANIDRWRRDKGREVLTDEVPETRPAAASDDAARVADHDAVRQALAELSDRERRVVVLRFLSDMSEADTAAALGIPVGTVKSVTNRAVAKLRASRHLDGRDEVTA